MKVSIFSPSAIGTAALAMALLAPVAAAKPMAEQIVNDQCRGCHTEERSDVPQWSRISHQRKSPEGWLMTIGRMQVMHGLQITDADRRTLVKYLADRQGLAPEEAKDFRYAMERRLNTQESFDSAEFTEMCSRCHSGARVALQRRSAAEWEHLVHFHLGQWPTLEYQAMSRDRDWLGVALNTLVPQLTEVYPFESAVWDQWQQAEKPSLTGQWRIVGNMPGKGDLEGSMTISGSETEGYQLSLNGRYADGSELAGSGQGVVYTGYEWRANLEIDGVKMRQVMMSSKDGSRLEGRMFETHHDEIGVNIHAVKDIGLSQVIAVQPGYIKVGMTQTLTVVGNHLAGNLSLGQGVVIDKVLARSDDRIEVQATAAKDAHVGNRNVKVGSSDGADLVVFDQIDRIQVVPSYSIARVGGDGGSSPKVSASFQAVAWAAGTDNKVGTDDDLQIGFMPATWRVEPFDEVAKADRDVDYAGTMNAATGVFIPGDAGLNPERRMSTNNVGNLKVVADLHDGDNVVSGEGQMLVTVQRWNNPPLP